ncbi:MAG: hypothetical protein ABIA78_02440 [archaeon]
MEKKQIIFIEPKPTAMNYRIARSLKLTGEYETILFCFSKVDKEFYGKAYNHIFELELSHKLNRNFFRIFINFLNTILSERGRIFLKKLREVRPYIFQVTGPDVFSLMALSLSRKDITKIYFSNDMWGVETRKALFKRFGLKGEFQRICERICFKMVDGVLNKHSLGQFELLNYKVNAPKMALLPCPLDEWIFPPKQKKNNEIHIVYGGSPFPSWNNNTISFLDLIKIFTLQKIHLHSYGPSEDAGDNQILREESRNNLYYHFHERVSPYNLNEESSEYTYGILPDFRDKSEVEENPGILKTENAAKVTNYLEAGLPTITSAQNEYTAEIINKYKIGFSIEEIDLKNFRKILEAQNYLQLQKNVRKFQKESSTGNIVKDIEKFYEKVRMKKLAQ